MDHFRRLIIQWMPSSHQAGSQFNWIANAGVVEEGCDEGQSQRTKKLIINF